jgi:mono/diheme cytochrome c family protein
MMQRRKAQEKIQRNPHRRAFNLCASLLLLLVPLAGCRQDMQDQPKFYPQRGSSLYADGRSVRPQVAGTVARSQGEPQDYFHTGLVEGKEADGLPIPLTAETMAHGQERFNIYCTPCHSRVGNGAGRIVERGYYPAASFHSTRLRDAPLGHFFQVMTNGYGAMPNYAVELSPSDRWAIAAYIRALQLSQNAKREDIAAGQKVETLQNVVAKQGLPSEFLEAWFPPSHTHATPAAAVSVATATTVKPVPVKDSAQPKAPAKLSTEVVTKTTPVAAEAKVSATSTMQPASALETTAPVKKEPVPAAHDADAGKMVYMHNCAACHQISRAGLPPNIPSLIGIVPKVGEARIRTVIDDGIPTGKPPMPSFSSRLSADDVENLLSFLQASK